MVAGDLHRDLCGIRCGTCQAQQHVHQPLTRAFDRQARPVHSKCAGALCS